MKTDKYYIPKIREFHVGFEYEYWGHLGEEFGKFIQKKIVLNTNFSLLRDLIVSCSIRVKFLDKQDIEDLGFEIKSDKIDFLYFEKINNSDISITYELYNKDKIFIQIESDDLTVFAGNIKNKSELKKLLEMLSINE